jgi:hypothetical protein
MLATVSSLSRAAVHRIVTRSIHYLLCC